MLENQTLGPLASKFKNATAIDSYKMKQYSLACLLLPDFSNQLSLLIIISVKSTPNHSLILV